MLKASGVRSFKNAGLEVEFHMEQPAVVKPVEEPLAPRLADTQAPDLKADDTMDYDKVLFWSGSPGPSEEELPLTGQMPLPSLHMEPALAMQDDPAKRQEYKDLAIP